ncbi:MAG: Asp-tRNA(Asn)/Glu-tRNA(Gln) amidotransferase subunit GatB [Christensenellaceae bacterium]|jgi:aspartyl-tRNA(Asn)/glutamyl-tRNA(Gln) amidotransferase subunit B|nr:Asp-tRNA(Asn)/Glu-tRNA(Gln) amidotransferase subunit GatB [Christensenellaceae bacterium]
MSIKDFDITIGLEIHAELNTNTKVFCSCKNEFGAEPNTNVCPVCIGLPGALPVINRKAVELAVKAGLCMGCKISPLTIFERKNYFYPDLSKAYQISQLQKPLCLGGGITLDSGKFIRLNRIHLEEDAGKLTHVNSTVGSLIDYNRGGVPLIEIVTEPDITNAEDAVEFMMKLRSNLVFGGIAECRMEQGGMRCDVNLSVKPAGSKVLGTRTEMKNLNSFKMVGRAIDYEAKRQVEAIENGEKIIQQTRKWDDNKGKSFAMRNKEEANDYRYFPDPDILAIKVGNKLVSETKLGLPRLSEQRKNYYVTELKLPLYDAKILTSELFISNYFEEVLKQFDNAKIVSNWIMTEVLRKLKEKETNNLNDIILVSNLVQIIKMVEQKEITRLSAKELFEKVCFTKLDAKETAKTGGILTGISENEIIKIIDEALAANPRAVEDYKTEPDKVIKFFMGQVMRKTAGAAKVEVAMPILQKKLSEQK